MKHNNQKTNKGKRDKKNKSIKLLEISFNKITNKKNHCFKSNIA